MLSELMDARGGEAKRLIIDENLMEWYALRGATVVNQRRINSRTIGHVAQLAALRGYRVTIIYRRERDMARGRGRAEGEMAVVTEERDRAHFEAMMDIAAGKKIHKSTRNALAKRGLLLSVDPPMVSDAGRAFMAQHEDWGYAPTLHEVAAEAIAETDAATMASAVQADSDAGVAGCTECDCPYRYVVELLGEKRPEVLALVQTLQRARALRDALGL